MVEGQWCQRLAKSRLSPVAGAHRNAANCVRSMVVGEADASTGDVRLIGRVRERGLEFVDGRDLLGGSEILLQSVSQ